MNAERDLAESGPAQNEPKGAPACELRRRQTQHGRVEISCAAGGFLLGVQGRDDDRIRRICGACPIPRELADDAACLHLRPIRIEEGGELLSYFCCRWFYVLNPRRQPTALHQQCPCPHWFPRPEVDLIPGYVKETDTIRDRI